MPLVRVNGVNLYYEMTGEGPVPLIFSHEFAGDHMSIWGQACNIAIWTELTNGLLQEEPLALGRAVAGSSG